MNALARKLDCYHDWTEVCRVYHRRTNQEGVALRCKKCSQLGFQKLSYLNPVSDIQERQKRQGEIILVSGMDVCQTEYGIDGRPTQIWDTHL
jgi:hypothetical protein